jgi:hypothetical protein
MEYLVLAGGDMKEALSRQLGAFAPFFWGILVPVALAVLWLFSAHALWKTWNRPARGEGEGSGVLGKLIFSLFLAGFIVGAGSGLEYLVLGGGYVHARVLGGVLALLGIQ